MTDYTASELLAVMASREMTEVNTLFAGVGTPLLAAILAQKTFNPNLTIVVEGGSIGPQVVPGLLPISTNEMRISHRAQMVIGITEIFLLTQRGFLEMGFIGGAQIDRFGNVNTTVIGDYAQPKVKLPGSGGANDIASLCRRIILVTTHERRRFVSRVDFITSPGWLDGGETRRKAGLVFGRIERVITNLCVMGFEPESKAMRVEALHPGTTIEEVQDNTGFDLIVPDHLSATVAPEAAEIEMLRAIDIDRRYIS
jgi:glutaconate CoA-transferase subunit B